MQNIVQRSSEWRDMRAGRFTGSEIHKLLGIKGLGKTGESYAFEKAVEIVFGRDEDENFESFDMKRGKELEPYAFAKFKEMKELEFTNVEECVFFPYGDNAGASPDGLCGDDGVVEIKCPRPTKFFNIVANGLSVIDSEYYDQMQMEMLCAKCDKAYFFNYLIYNGQPMWHELLIERDETRISFIKARIEEATIVRDRFVEQLKNNAQF